MVQSVAFLVLLILSCVFVRLRRIRLSGLFDFFQDNKKLTFFFFIYLTMRTLFELHTYTVWVHNFFFSFHRVSQKNEKSVISSDSRGNKQKTHIGKSTKVTYNGSRKRDECVRIHRFSAQPAQVTHDGYNCKNRKKSDLEQIVLCNNIEISNTRRMQCPQYDV